MGSVFRLRPSGALAVLLALAGSGSACAPVHHRIYAPADLRAELMRRAPERPDLAKVVPHEVPPEAVERARQVVAVARATTERARVSALVEAMFEPVAAGGFGLRYEEAETVGAAAALLRGTGNCLDLASIFIGLARAVGLRAEYMDASHRVHDTREVAGGITLRSGHVTAAADLGGDRVGLDFARLGPILRYRLMDDVEAVAHFHNNRGWDGIDRALTAGTPVDWEAALSEFEAAVLLEPGFAAGWNNAGIAAARLGRRAEAIEDYRRAAEEAPGLAAPRVNLAALLLQVGEVAGAISELEAALKAEPGDPTATRLLASARERLRR